MILQNTEKRSTILRQGTITASEFAIMSADLPVFVKVPATPYHYGPISL